MATPPPYEAAPQPAPTSAAADEVRSAVDRVSNITELLERILLAVARSGGCLKPEKGLQTLILSQRVNKIFMATINNSNELLRALWILPPPAGQHPADVYGYNPILVNARNLSEYDRATPRMAQLSFSTKGMVIRTLYLKPCLIFDSPNSGASWTRMHLIAPARVDRAIWLRAVEHELRDASTGKPWERTGKMPLDKTTSLSALEFVEKAC